MLPSFTHPAGYISLGILNVMTGATYGIADMVFIFAVFSSLLPSHYDNAVDFMGKSFKDVSF
jgi:hypothetical protein